MNTGSQSLDALADLLLDRVREIQADLAWAGTPADVHLPFADLLDSMGMVEFLLRVGKDIGVSPEAIEECVHHRFGTVWELAVSLHAAGFLVQSSEPQDVPKSPQTVFPGTCWLGNPVLALPEKVQSAAEINRLLKKPEGWLEEHAGIHQRGLWENQDILAAVADAARESLRQGQADSGQVGALLVTSEAPPLLVGLAADLHHRLGLAKNVPALEVGGACTGFLAALWLARKLLPGVGNVLVAAVEAPSRHLKTETGSAGEAAALFGDGAAACLVSGQPLKKGVLLKDITLGTDGSLGHLIRVEAGSTGIPRLHLQGQELAGRAVRTMAGAGQDLLSSHSLTLADIRGIVVHGGNGRLPELLARHLGLPAERVWSETPRLGNLGSASLPAAWAARKPISGPVLWTAVGAGLMWGAALTGFEK